MATIYPHRLSTAHNLLSYHKYTIYVYAIADYHLCICHRLSTTKSKILSFSDFLFLFLFFSLFFILFQISFSQKSTFLISRDWTRNLIAWHIPLVVNVALLSHWLTGGRLTQFVGIKGMMLRAEGCAISAEPLGLHIGDQAVWHTYQCNTWKPYPWG